MGASYLGQFVFVLFGHIGLYISHDKNICYIVLTRYKSLNRLSISRYTDL